jgi:hypothetical protein
MKYFISLALVGSVFGANAACTTESNFEVTFYGYPDNSPPGPGTAHDCGGRNYVAGGRLNISHRNNNELKVYRKWDI